MKRYYIGLCVSTHDAAVSIVDTQGNILFAEATERFLQYKRAPNCEPDNERLVSLLKQYCDADAEYVVAINWRKATTISAKLLTQSGITSPKTIFKSPNREVKFNTPFSLKTKMTNACASSMFDKLAVGFSYALQTAFGNCKKSIRFFPHHLCHAAIACYSSPYKEATCMIVDGAGDFGSFAFFQFHEGTLKLLKEQKGFTSLGRFYADITWLCGFNPDKGEEWKVMGFAPYGQLHNPSFSLLTSLFSYSGYQINSASSKRYSQILKEIDSWLKNGQLLHADLAFTAQKVFTDTLVKALNIFHESAPSENLTMAGGCMLNSSTAGLIVENTPFDNLFIPCAPADDGTSLGAALLAFHEDHPNCGSTNNQSAYLGSEIPCKQLDRFVQLSKNPNIIHCSKDIHIQTAKLLSQGKLVGWVQGRAEFGPRSLGNRSILADPRSADMKDKINSLVKFREEFRPFAPSILHEHGDEYFENYQESRYMERTLQFKQEVFDKVPAVVHINGSGRLQTVKSEWNKRFYDLITAFYSLTDVPILLNTSFNVMGKPIIHTIEDAVSVFYTTGLDALVINDYIIEK